MPFINYPIECTICKGSGKVKPAFVFAIHSEKMGIDCMQCDGKGHIENKVYVNPEVEEIPQKIDESKIDIGELPREGYVNEKEIEELFEEVKKVKSSKKSKEV